MVDINSLEKGEHLQPEHSRIAGSLIRQARFKNNLTLDKLANKVGLSKNDLDFIERGIIRVPTEKKAILGSILGICPSQMK